MNIKKYEKEIQSAVKHFWKTRNDQKINQADKGIEDLSNRGSVTGGKQLNGFIDLLVLVAIDTGVPKNCIYVKGNQLPGYFRPTKDWDIVVISPSNKLIAAIELKSQVGSFGNNFNNRTEEALGSALDLWTAFREKAFPNQSLAPWLGYMMIVEKTLKSTTPVRVYEPYFKVLPEFYDTSYIDRYKIFCQKLILERHYNSCCLIWASGDHTYGDVDDSISVRSFLQSFVGHLIGQLNEFK